MPKARTQHPNASLTPLGRRKMVRLVIDDGWTIEAAADKFQVDAKTVTKWRDRFLDEGENGLYDRSSRPKNSFTRGMQPAGSTSGFTNAVLKYWTGMAEQVNSTSSVSTTDPPGALPANTRHADR